jgi:hypothetical protein
MLTASFGLNSLGMMREVVAIVVENVNGSYVDWSLDAINDLFKTLKPLKSRFS